MDGGGHLEGVVHRHAGHVPDAAIGRASVCPAARSIQGCRGIAVLGGRAGRVARLTTSRYILREDTLVTSTSGVLKASTMPQ